MSQPTIATGGENILEERREPRVAVEVHVPFHRYLEVHPEARHAMEQRLREYPDYHAWLRAFAPGLLAILES